MMNSEAASALDVDDGHRAAGGEARNEDAQAGRAYARALALAPNQGAMLNNHGAWLCRNDRAAESLVHFERALADPAYARRLTVGVPAAAAD